MLHSIGGSDILIKYQIYWKRCNFSSGGLYVSRAHEIEILRRLSSVRLSVCGMDYLTFENATPTMEAEV